MREDVSPRWKIWLFRGGRYSVALLPLLMWFGFDFVAPKPYWLARGDSEQDITFLALRLLHGYPHGHPHPGTPVLYLHAWLLRLAGGTLEDVPRYLLWGDAAVALVRALGVALALWLMGPRTPWRIRWAVALLWMTHPTFWAFAEIHNTDSYLAPVGLLFALQLWRLLQGSPFSHLWEYLFFAFLGGLLLSIKLAALPIVLSGLATLALYHIWVGWRRKKVAWALLLLMSTGLITGMVFIVLATLPIPSLSEAWRLVTAAVLRPETRTEAISWASLRSVYLKIINPQDHYWIGVVLIWGLLLAWRLLHESRYALRHRLRLLSISKTLLLVWLAINVGVWLYTVTAQRAHLADVQIRVLSIGYLLRNTYPPTWAFLLVLLPWERKDLFPRNRRSALLLILSALAFGIAAIGFYREREEDYVFMQRQAEAIQAMMERYRGVGAGRIAFWITKGLPLVPEVAFYYEGFYYKGFREMEAVLLEKFPDYTLFNLRNLGTLPNLPELLSTPCPSPEARRISVPPPFVGAGKVDVEFLVFWDWEMRVMLHLSPEEVAHLVCFAGYQPVRLFEERTGPFRWIWVELERWKDTME